MKYVSTTTACAALAVMWVFTACGNAAPTSPASAFAGDADAIARGEGIFRGACGAYCHGLKPDNRDALFLFDCTWKHGASDDEIFQVIANGVPGSRMLGFGEGLSTLR